MRLTNAFFAVSACAAYGKPLMLSAVDFTTTAGDKFIGWGFVPASVKALYPKGKKGLL